MGSTTTTLDNKEKKKKQNTSSSLILCFTSKCFPISSSTTPSSSSRSMLPPPSLPEYEYSGELPAPSKPSSTTTGVRKPGGWKSMPYILGMETFERLATIGLLANFTVFLMTVFHMTQVGASNLMNIWSGITNFAPLVGAFISDAYFGKFWVIAFSSSASLLGMVTMTVISLMPRLHPPTCKPHLSECKGPTTPQMTFLVLALGFLSIGAGGIRPCSIPFGVDQFDPTTDEGRKGINSFFNWYYTTFTVVLIIALTLVVYIQDSVSWVWGFGIPTLLMMSAIVLYFVGTRLYVYVKPQGSIFSGIAQACVAAFKKRKVQLPPDGGKEAGEFYDPPLIEGTYPIPRLPLTNRFRFLNKAARIMDGDLKPDGSRVNPYRLASIQQIEEVKCIIKVVPVLASSLVCFVAMAQQTTFTISQALTMNRHLGPDFQIPPGSLGVISMITIGIWLPFYDRILVPKLRKITKIEGGITLLQRIGIGIFFSIIAMIVAGLVERMRRDSALSHNGPNGPAPLSVFWLAPQLVLMGFAEAFNIIGQIEFYYKEFPENMKSVANSLFSVTGGVASYLSTALVVTVHNVTGRKGRPDWLTKNINEGRVDYFYYLIAGLGFLNLMYFLIIAPQYQYTSRMKIDEDESQFDLELNDIKKKTETP